jgi:hypothetical protein
MSLNAAESSNIDQIIEVAIEKLRAAKEALFSFRSTQESLASEKTSLESVVEDLRSEKTHFGFAIQNMKSELDDLGDQLTTTKTPPQDTVLQHTLTTGSGARIEYNGDEEQSRNEDDNGVFVQNCSTTDSDEDFDMVLDSQQDHTVLDNPPTRSAVNQDHERVVGIIGACDREIQAHTNDSFTDDETMSVSTVVTASTMMSTTPPKRHARKSYNSPKKWRRMIRTRRLRSIFYNTN